MGSFQKKFNALHKQRLKHIRPVSLIEGAPRTGKTRTVELYVKQVLEKNPRAKVLILSHRIQLLNQHYEVFKSSFPDLEVGRFNGSHKDISAQILIATAATLYKNLHLFKKDHFQVQIVDEAHHAPATTWEECVLYFKDEAGAIGLSGTSERPDGKSLENIFGASVPELKLSVAEAQDKGILAKEVAYIILTDSTINGKATLDGDYSAKTLDRLWGSNDRNKIIIDSYRDIARKEMDALGLKYKTICFCCNLEHAKKMREVFRENLISAETLSYKTPNKKRQTILDSFTRTDAVEVLCVVDLLNEGIDIPRLSCVLLTRPTGSHVVFTQQALRAGNIIEGEKDSFVILDFVDNIGKGSKPYTAFDFKPKSFKKEKVVTRYLTFPDSVIISKRVHDIFTGYTALKRVRVYTKEMCREEALKHESPYQWQSSSYESYVAAKQKGWLFECCVHMDYLPNIVENDCSLDARRFNFAESWRLASPELYWYSQRMGWFERCTSHMRKKLNWTRAECLKSALNYSHKSDWYKAEESAYKAALKGGWLEECCAHFIKMRRKEKWTKEICIESALKFSRAVDWEKSEGKAYQAARKKGWYKECCKHFKIPFRWTKKDCLTSALKFSSKSEWRKVDYNAYQAAKKGGWLKECSKHFRSSLWTKKSCLASALKYSSLPDWRKGDINAYNTAYRKGWINEFRCHFENSIFWKKEDCLASASKFLNKRDWRAFDRNAYTAAQRNGWFEECSLHFEAGRTLWTKEKCQASALKFHSSKDWERNDRKAYSAAVRRGWLTECSAHFIQKKARR